MTRQSHDVAPTVAPGPGGNPVTDQLKPFEKDPLRFLVDMHREYGDVVRLQLWPQLYHLITHPAGMRHVLATNGENYHWLPPSTPGDGPPAGEGGAGHDLVSARMSRLAHHVSHRDRLAVVAPAMSDAVDAMLTRWRPHAESGEQIDIAHEMVGVALLILGEALFDADLSDDLPRLVPALAAVLRHTAPQRRVSVYQVLEQSSATAGLAEAERTLDGLIARIIEERRRSGRDRGDVLSRLVLGRDDATGAPLTEPEVRATVMVFLVAGHSAVADAMAWTMYLLAEHPEAQRRLQEEVDTVLGGRAPTAGDLPELAYTLMVLREAMRLYPPVWMLAPRMALRDDAIEGYRIPGGSMILMSPYVTHRHPDFWEQPETFDPERFSGRVPAAYFPFGVGPWGCLGSQFGLLEARLMLAAAAQRYRWQLAPGRAVELEPQVSLRPRDGLWMVLQARAS